MVNFKRNRPLLIYRYLLFAVLLTKILITYRFYSNTLYLQYLIFNLGNKS